MKGIRDILRLGAETATGVPRQGMFSKEMLPFTAAGGGLVGGWVGQRLALRAADVRGDFRRMGADLPTAEEEVYIDEGEELLRQRSLERRYEQQQRQIAANAAKLARLDPQSFFEVQAGRRLPRGGRVFGGTKRTDLLEELALMMGQGQLGPGAAPTSDIGTILRGAV